MLTCALAEMRLHQRPRRAQDSLYDETYPHHVTVFLMSSRKDFFQFLMGLPQQEHKLFRVLAGSVWKQVYS